MGRVSHVSFVEPIHFIAAAEGAEVTGRTVCHVAAAFANPAGDRDAANVKAKIARRGGAILLRLLRAERACPG